MKLCIPHARTVAEIVGAVLLLSTGAASAAAMIPAAAPTTIHACENTKTGALSVRLHANCPADGQLLPIASNAALFSLLGTKYGGNGTSTFALPNLKKAAPDGLSYSICQFGVFP